MTGGEIGHVVTAAGLALDVAVLVLLGMVVWRLGYDPAARWSAHEERLRELSVDLRALLAQSEGLARDLDAKLADHYARWRTLVTRAERPAPPAAEAPSRAEVAARVRELADAEVPVEEIARRLGIAVAEARVLVGLRAARAELGARPRPAPRSNGQHAATMAG